MDLLTLFLFQGLAAFSGQLLNFALIWQILNWYHSPFLMSVCAGVGILLTVLLTPWIGQTVDRMHRLKVAGVGNALSVTGSLGLFAYLPLLHGQRYGIAVIVVFYALRAVATQIQLTATMAALADMGTDETRGQLFARWQTIASVSQLLAVPLSAALMTVFHLNLFVLIDMVAVSMAVINSWRLARRVPMHAVESVANGARQSTFQGLKSTWGYLREDAVLTTLLLAIPFLNFVGSPIGTLFPALVKIDWHLGVKDLAIAETLSSVGILISSVLQSAWTPKVSRVRLIVVSLSTVTVAIGMMAGWRGASPYLLYGGMFLCGFSIMFVNIPLQTAIATCTPESMRGRVDSVLTVLCGASAPLGLVLFGAMAEWTGTRPVMWLDTLLYAVVILVLAMRLGGLGRSSPLTPV